MRIPSSAMSPMAVSESGDQASRFFPLAGIRRIAPSCSPILKQLGLICKREPTQRGLTKRQLLAEHQRMLRFPSSRRTSPVSLAQTRDKRTPYADDATGGDRNSAISRRMSANKFLGMASSAIWKAT
jgi:hypothetical protein